MSVFNPDGIRRDADGYMVSRGLGSYPRSSDKPVRTYVHDGPCKCGARLSVFNSDPVCAACSGERWADH